jgi:hypothetical protein
VALAASVVALSLRLPLVLQLQQAVQAVQAVLEAMVELEYST